MPLHLYFGDDHWICPICGYKLPCEYFVLIGKIWFCHSCAEGLK